ncbi:MAG: thiamine-phosphate kinase [Chloroflexota bacterium]|nr:thiamine-phosphate kinase [Chloroflexota bacterium]
MKVHELGEFALIDLIAETIGKTSRDDLVLGIGDDAAAWRTGQSIQIGTTDTLVENIHFTLETATWRDLGWKALAINISDIAAMGGKPCYALVSLGLPPETEVDNVVELYKGLMEIATQFDVDICGGNVSSAPVAVINITVIGEASEHLLTRSAAQPGDQIAVTGYLGQAGAGLRMLKSRLEFSADIATYLRDAHLRPYPGVAEGQVLVQHGVRAAIDLSDGLVSDLGHICKASHVGAKVWVHTLPIHPLVNAAFGEKSLGLALSGGEDYELLFTAKSEVVDRVKYLMSSPVTVIGEITSSEPGQVTLCDEQGRALEWNERGWEHFRSGR